MKLFHSALAVLLLAGCAFVPVPVPFPVAAAPAVEPTPTPAPFIATSDPALPVAFTVLQMLVNPALRAQKPPTGYQTVGLEVVYENVSAESAEPNRFGFEVVDGEGFVYPSQMVYPQDLPTFEGTVLRAGQKVRGWVFFFVPQGATLDHVRMYDPRAAAWPAAAFIR